MLIDEAYTRCVAFLWGQFPSPDGGTSIQPGATVFFVGLVVGAITHVYAVTARHVIDSSRPFGAIWIRVPTETGHADLPVPHESWVTSASSDVAVVPVVLPADHAVYWIPEEKFENDRQLREYGLGLGADVFSVGLFHPHHGGDHGQPIVNFGNISLMPNDDVPVGIHTAPQESARIAAYLVDCRSWAGHSGSPMFLHFPVGYLESQVDRSPGRMPGAIMVGNPLIGMVQGHFTTTAEARLLGDVGEVRIDAGKAIVVPIEDVRATLEDERLVLQRGSPTGDIADPAD